MKVPMYPEISVKDLYPEAVLDPEVAPYLPDFEEGSHKLPERDFFFGILATKKTEYLKKIISDAHLARMKGEEEKEEKEVIMIKQDWLDELNRHPHVSSKTFFLNHFRKTW
jgi:hypothetical protein